MKTFLFFFLYSLVTEGVFGKSVSLTLTEGDSATLHTGLAEIPQDEEIEWRFELLRIGRAKKNNEPSTYDVLNGKFRGRLQLNGKTGDITITSIKTTDKGVYKVSNSISDFEESFNVTVVSVDQMHSVLVGEFVTLQTGLTDTQNYDVIRWKFGPQLSTIAVVNIKDRTVSTSNGPDKTFRDRRQLDYRTGSLTITNTRTEDSGLYEVDIIKNSSYTIHKTYNVTIRGKVKSLSVMEGKSVMLHPDTEIQYNDFILWMFGDTVIVSRSIYKAKQQVSIYDVPDGRFRDRLKLDNQTGSLTITNTTTLHAGLYKLQITTSRHTVNRKFLVSFLPNVKAFTDLPSGGKAKIGIGFVIGAIVVAAVSAVVFCCYRSSVLKGLSYEDKVLPVMEGGQVILKTDAKVRRDVLIQWVREDTLIAEINGGTRKFSIYDDVLNGKLSHRLKLDNQTGSLTISNITRDHAGLYTLKMIRGHSVSCKLFYVTLCDALERMSLAKDQSFTLPSGLTEIQEDDMIQCLFGDKANPIAKINGWAKESPTYYHDERFTGRVKMDQTGSLTITNTRTTDSGVYELHIFRSEQKLAKSFIVTVSDSTINRTNVPAVINMPLLSQDDSNNFSMQRL